MENIDRIELGTLGFDEYILDYEMNQVQDLYQQIDYLLEDNEYLYLDIETLEEFIEIQSEVILSLADDITYYEEFENREFE